MDHLAQIKADERRIKDAMERGDARIAVDPKRQYTHQQLRLREVMADEFGHLWIVGREELTRWDRTPQA